MRWILDVITILGFLLTAIGTYLTVRSDSTNELIQNELIRYGAIVTFLSILGWFHWFRKYYIAKSVFSRTSINEAHIKAMDFSKTWSKNKYSINECVSEYSKICQLMTKGFRQYHRVGINITVKYINFERNTDNANCEPKMYVRDLCRDIESQLKRSQRVSLHKDVKDYISDNTDFEHIYRIMSKRPIEDVYFFSNCLPCYIGYKNTHIHADLNVWWKRLISFFTIGMCGWALPYKSTIIVPISSTTSQGCEYIEGFLCADSSKPFIFSKKYDLVIMQEMASVLYSMTHLINQKHLVSKINSNNA